MYLFLVGSSFISSEQLQRMVGQIFPESDVVNCFSPATLLKLAEKVDPKLIIIDYDLISGDKMALIETIRKSCPDTYILALIEPDYYDTLYRVIELGLVDDYMVKPVSDEEFAARIMITVKRRKPEAAGVVTAASVSEQPKLIEEKFSDFEGYKNLAEQDIYNISTSEEFNAISFEEPVAGDVSPGSLHAEPGASFLTGGEAPEPVSGVYSDEYELPAFTDAGEQLPEAPVEISSGGQYFEDLLADHRGRAKPQEVGEDILNADWAIKEGTLDFTAEEDRYRLPDRPTLPKPPDLEDLPEMLRPPERDISYSIKDFMPGESADDYLSRREIDEGVSYNENMLEQFLGDEEYDEEEQYETAGKSGAGLTGFLSVLVNIIFAFLLLMMGSLSFFLIHDRVADGPPTLAGHMFYVMKDNGINADVNPGSLAVVREIDPAELAVGDLITYRTDLGPQATATRRVVEVKREDNLQLITRGDDPAAVQTIPVEAGNLIGKVVFSLPYVGLLVDYVKTSQGLILLIFVPGIIIILYQLVKIIKHLSAGKAENRYGRGRRYSELVEEEEY